jgi:maleamate amidohydrolase
MTDTERRDAWDAVVPEDVRALYRRAGYGRPGGLGRSPALLVVDVTYDFVGDRDEPISASMERYPKSCGRSGWAAVECLQRLLPQARAAGVPVIYSVNPPRVGRAQEGAWARKTASTPTADAARPGWEIVEQLAPADGDLVVEKTKPSAFFGTPLASWLIELGTDTLLIAGGTTSGCVRASTVDAFSHNFRVGVVADATFDRADVVRAMSLFDVQQKYGDVLDTDAASVYLSTGRAV